MSEELNTVASPTSAEAGSGDEKKSNAMSASQLAQFLASKETSSVEAVETQAESTTETEPVVEAEKSEATPDDENSDVLSQIDLDSLDPRTKAFVESQLEAQKSAIQEKVNKRIGKEVAKTKEAQEKIAQYEAQLAQLTQQIEQIKAAPPTVDPVGEVPLADLNDIQSLISKQQEAKQALSFAEERLEDGVPEEGVEIEGKVYTRADFLTIKRNARRVLDDQIPKRHQFLQAKEAASKQAAQLFPWWSNKESEEHKIVQAQLQSAPWAKKLPNIDVIIGLIAEGTKAVNARLSQSQTKAKAPLDQVTTTTNTKGNTRMDAETLVKKGYDREFKELGKRGNLSQAELAKMLAKRS